METIKEFFHRPFVRRVLFFAGLALILFLMRSMLSLFLLTFIFIYLINAAQQFLYRHIHRLFPVKRSFIVLFLYIAVLALLAVVVYNNVATVITQTVAVIQTVVRAVRWYYKHPDTSNQVTVLFNTYLSNIDVGKYAENGGKYLISAVTNLGTLLVDLLFSLVLSLFFMLEKPRILSFLRRIQQSRLRFLYEDARYFGLKFTNSFGKVIETQILISLINSAVSVVALAILGFPNLLGLWAMVFLLGLVPVAGVFISLVPLCVIGYGVGGLREIVYVIILVAVLHALEGYVLNPKLMSHNTKLPVFITFLVLIISEHFFGVWGLIVGIPVVMFLLDIFEVPLDRGKEEGEKPWSTALNRPKS